MIRKSYLAIDIGASSGKAIYGILERNNFETHEIFRFLNEPVYINGSLRWNILSLWSNILNSIYECHKAGFENLNSIGIDTWGVDFVLLDKNGQIIFNPYHYRDNLTEGVEEKIREKIKDEELYKITGLFPGRVSSLSQLISLKEKASWVLDVAKTFLMIPDFFRYCLCNSISCDITSAGSSQMLDLDSCTWSNILFDLFSLPSEIMPTIEKPGKIAGKLGKELAEFIPFKNLDIVITAGHDTASAAASVPFIDDDTLFISTGTWAVFGFINDKPLINNKIFQAGFINEPGFDCFLIVRNMSGLYLFENLFRQLNKQHKDITYKHMIDSALTAKPFQVFINPNDSTFFSVNDVMSAITIYCNQTGQKVTKNLAEIFRAILEGVALSFRQALKDLETSTDRVFKRICVVGGGLGMLFCVR